MMNWKGIAEFMAVYETGSFSKAAERMDMTVSQVSKRVTELEIQLGAPLFERSTRAVRPSTQGMNYYQACANALSELSQAADSMHADLHSISGQLPAAHMLRR